MRAVDYLRSATSKDPTCALFYAGLADAYRDLGWDLFAVRPPAEVYPSAKQAAQRALELDPNCAEAHAALAWITTTYDWDWSAAEKEFRFAIDLRPGYGLCISGTRIFL
jgi:tetratricopeptide (TPR) repeat protein